MQLKCCCLLFAGVVALASAGCGGEATEPTYPVTGIVRLNGEPIAGAVVSFSTAGKSAVGKTDASGRYTLTTHKSGDGAPAGRYKVSISKYDNPAGDETAPIEGSPSNVDITAPVVDEYPEDYDEMAESEKAAMTATNTLPEKYASGETSGFEVEVKQGDNTYDFDLEG